MPDEKRSLIPDILKISFIFLVSVIVLALVAFFMARFLIKGNQIEVPNVIGKSFIEAFDILSESGLRTQKMDERKYSAELPENYVVEQRPVPGTKVKKGREITIFLSRGTEEGTIPRLIGQPFSEAENILKSVGLKVGSVARIHSDDYPQRGMIIAHTPTPGVTIQRGSEVNLLVSMGPLSAELTMPDLGGKNLDNAVKELESMGLKTGRITRKVSPAINQADVVLEQSPLPNDQVAAGIAVDLVVSSAGESQSVSSRIVFLRYEVPARTVDPDQPGQEDTSPRYLKIIVEDQNGVRTIEDGMFPPGETKVYPLRISGRGIAKIYVDDTKWPVETRKL
ncbi:PASTA domain-containing protein [Candidatus Poribacteria bacterium]|nr:PASTA domain-containing protein [Candidatus Poribacteria bacterium]